MDKKTCTKCNIEKEYSLFHISKYSKTGRRPTCKSCSAEAQRTYMNKKLSIDENVEKRRKYARDYYHKIGGYKSVNTKNRNSKKAHRRRRLLFPEKVSAGFSIMHLKVEKGFHKHHWSYNKSHWRDIIIMSAKDHLKSHRFIVYDKERMMYRRFDNNDLLDTKEKHEKFIKNCIDNYED